MTCALSELLIADPVEPRLFEICPMIDPKQIDYGMRPVTADARRIQLAARLKKSPDELTEFDRYFEFEKEFAR